MNPSVIVIQRRLSDAPAVSSCTASPAIAASFHEFHAQLFPLLFLGHNYMGLCPIRVNNSVVIGVAETVSVSAAPMTKNSALATAPYFVSLSAGPRSVRHNRRAKGFQFTIR